MSVASMLSLFLASFLVMLQQCRCSRTPHAHSAPLQARTILGSNFGIPTVNQTYDYVIVGGGTAGLVMASRLSQNPAMRVAVVEAGSFYEITSGNTSQIPADDSTHWNGKDFRDSNPLVDWGFHTTPQAAINNDSVHYARGKTLGGCSALNYMAYVLPTTGAMDFWAQLVNDSSYEYTEFEPHFLKSMNFTQPDNAARAANSTPSYDAATLGSRGPLDLSFSKYAQPFSSWFPAAMESVGIPRSNGFTSGSLNGSSWNLATIDPTTATRDSSETSFLRAALGRPNFLIYPDTLAENILFNGSQATGVLVNSGGARYTLSAAKEVIVSAGTFQSPQLLMVSGVGPSATLAQHSIRPISPLPGVGQGMNDHIFYGITYRVNVVTGSSLANADVMRQAIIDYNERQDGPLSNNGGDLLAYEKFPAEYYSNFSQATRSALSAYPSDWPDLEYLIIPAFVGNQSWPGMIGPNDGYNYGTLAVSYMKPLSRGSIGISSSSMSDAPLINPNWLSNSSDVQQAIAAFKRTRQIFESPAMANLTIGPEYYPGAGVSTDEEILDYIRVNLGPVFHPTSTCRMGPATDPMAVLDSSCRVYGTKQLRVVDASAFPFLPAGLPQSQVCVRAIPKCD